MGVIALSVFLWWGYNMYGRWLVHRNRMLLAKALNEEMVRQHMACIITTPCPCGKEMVNIPFHPQAEKAFKCKKCQADCTYDFKIHTSVKG